MVPQKTILLVDDEEEILRATSIWFSAAGYKTSTARDGVEAIAAVVENRPDAIVMDVRMPRKDGLTALAELQQRDDVKHIPTVILSASIIDRDKALDAGATFFLTKPYQGRKLVEAVNVAIDKAQVASEPEQSHGTTDDMECEVLP